MSSSMISFMEAYRAVHNPDAKQAFYENRDFISEMDLSPLHHADLVDIAEQVVDEMFKADYTVSEAKWFVGDSFHHAPPVQEHKVSRLNEAFKVVFAKVDEAASTVAREEFGKYLKLKALDKQRAFMNSVDESHIRVHRHATKTVFEDVRSLLLHMIEKKADKDYDGDGKVESGKDEYFGSRDKAIKKAKAKKNPASKEEALRKADDLAGAPMEATEYNTYGAASPKMHKDQMKAMAGASDRKKQIGKADLASAAKPFRNKGIAKMAEEHSCDDDDDKKKKKQGYNDRLDDSLGAKHGKKSQSEKDRRDESEGMEKSKGKRKYSGDKQMDESQGYNARLDDSLGAKHGKKKQSLKSRRDESEGMEKAKGKRKYSGDKKMDEMFSQEELDAIFEKVAQWNEEGPAYPYETKAQSKAQKDHRQGKSAKGIKTGKNAPSYEASRTAGYNRTK